MNASIYSIIQQLEIYIQKAHQSGNKYDFIDPAQELFIELEELENPEEAIEPLFLLIERSPDIDYGGPGPLGQFLEAFEGGIYEEKLLESLQRKPTLYTIHLLDMLLQDSNDPQQARYLDTMRTIAVNPVLPEDIRQEAMDNLQYALENLHPWDDALKERLGHVETLLEEADAQHALELENLKQHQPPAPVDKVNHNGIVFKVLTRKAAEAYLPTVTDMPGMDTLYDIWDEWRFPTWHENGYFLLAEEEVEAQKLELDYSIDGVDDITVLGFIFLKGLKLDTYLMAFDTDNSPALIVHGDLQCQNIHLFGNVHYIGGKVTADFIWAKYNHGELYLNGYVEAKTILADDMSVFIRQVADTTALVSIMGMNIYVKHPLETEWLQRPSTHGLEEVFVAEVYETDEWGETGLREEGPDTALERIKQNKPFLKWP